MGDVANELSSIQIQIDFSTIRPMSAMIRTMSLLSGRDKVTIRVCVHPSVRSSVRPSVCNTFVMHWLFNLIGATQAV